MMRDFARGVMPSLAPGRIAFGLVGDGVLVYDWDAAEPVFRSGGGMRGDPDLSPDGRLVGYFDQRDVGVVIEIASGRVVAELGIVRGNFPIRLRNQSVVYQKDTTGVYERDLATGLERRVGEWLPTGIAYLTPTGYVSNDQNLLTQFPMLNPSVAGGFTAGSLPDVDGRPGVSRGLGVRIGGEFREIDPGVNWLDCRVLAGVLATWSPERGVCRLVTDIRTVQDVVAAFDVPRPVPQPHPTPTPQPPAPAPTPSGGAMSKGFYPSGWDPLKAPGVRNGMIVDPKAYLAALFTFVAGRRIDFDSGQAFNDWRDILERSGIRYNLPGPGEPTPPDTPHGGIAQQVGQGGDLRSRIFLPTTTPDDNGWYMHEIDIVVHETQKITWQDHRNDPPYVPRRLADTAPTPGPTPPPQPSGEVERLRAKVEELQRENDQLRKRPAATGGDYDETQATGRRAIEAYAQGDLGRQQARDLGNIDHVMPSATVWHLAFRYLREGYTAEQVIADAKSRGEGTVPA